MALDIARLIVRVLAALVPRLPGYLYRLAAARVHQWTWKDTADAKNVVVIGGSFAGVELVTNLANALPTGYKVVWIEKNSHFNYLFAFPRFSVTTGLERKAFIPYDGVARDAPHGILSRIQDSATEITKSHVVLASGQTVEYAYLAIATGSSQPLPSKVLSTASDGGCAELRHVQGLIQESHSIALVGGGPVGVELAADIKSFYPKKSVTLVHSRGRLLSYFGPRLGDSVLETLRNKLGVQVRLNERPILNAATSLQTTPRMLVFSDGTQEHYDLVIPCIGQQPNSALLSSLLPKAISPTSSRILVRPSLQVASSESPDASLPIFALGDVAEHGGPRMARAGHVQAEIVARNIVDMIAGKTKLASYKPCMFIEGSIRLTLGKDRSVIYSPGNYGCDGTDVLLSMGGGPLDLGVKRAWSYLGADFSKA